MHWMAGKSLKGEGFMAKFQPFAGLRAAAMSFSS
jgi:hypothetical protein